MQLPHKTFIVYCSLGKVQRSGDLKWMKQKSCSHEAYSTVMEEIDLQSDKSLRGYSKEGWHGPNLEGQGSCEQQETNW